MPRPKMPPITTEDSLDVAARTIYTVDGYWFLSVEEKYGFDAAFEMNQHVWKQIGPIYARRLLKKMKFDGKAPLEKLAAMVVSDPIMVVHNTYVTGLNENKLVIRTKSCPPSEARYKAGRGIYNGIPGCSLLLGSHARAVDGRIVTKCICCTPNPENPEYWCEWEFTLPTM